MYVCILFSREMQGERHTQGQRAMPMWQRVRRCQLQRVWWEQLWILSRCHKAAVHSMSCRLRWWRLQRRWSKELSQVQGWLADGHRNGLRGHQRMCGSASSMSSATILCKQRRLLLVPGMWSFMRWLRWWWTRYVQEVRRWLSAEGWQMSR